MATTSASFYSAAREPDGGEWEDLRTLDDILAWARIGGAMDYVPSQRGSLMIAAGGDVETTIEEFAAIPTDNFLHILESFWMYSLSKEPGRQLQPGHDYRPIRDHQGQGDLGSSRGSPLGRG